MKISTHKHKEDDGGLGGLGGLESAINMNIFDDDSKNNETIGRYNRDQPDNPNQIVNDKILNNYLDGVDKYHVENYKTGNQKKEEDLDPSSLNNIQNENAILTPLQQLQEEKKSTSKKTRVFF